PRRRGGSRFVTHVQIEVSTMRANFFLGSLAFVAIVSPGMALADPPVDRCTDRPPPRAVEIGSPGDFNQIVKDRTGSPGQEAKDAPLPANVDAQLRNGGREATCPPPGQTPP